MRVCVLQPVLDGFKGANHLPLFKELRDTQFVILCNRSNVKEGDLPSNVSVSLLPGRMGPYYYGVSDYRFGALVLSTYPESHEFWKQFDVIHLNQVLGPQFVRLKETGVPVVYAVHHPVTADETVAVQESLLLEGWLWKIRYLLLKKWQRRLCREMPVLMTVSQTVKARLVADYGCPADRISVVPNGVDGKDFARGEKEAYDITAVGSFLHPRKGFRYLLQTYTQLAASGKRIVDIGRRSDEQRAQLQNIQGVEVLGMTSHAKLVESVRSSACLISTSLYEGFGLSLIEALAAGRPAFAFDVGAVREVLAPIDPTLIIPPRDTTTLSARVLEFLARPGDERRRKGEVYRNAVLERYSIERSGQALQALYAGLAR